MKLTTGNLQELQQGLRGLRQMAMTLSAKLDSASEFQAMNHLIGTIAQAEQHAEQLVKTCEFYDAGGNVPPSPSLQLQSAAVGSRDFWPAFNR